MDVVFLSSTFIDLQPERQAVRDAVLRLRHSFSGMEYFGSDPERPTDVSLSILDAATVYVGLLGHRYGSVDSRSGKSITQLEWERARERGIPTLMYVKDAATPVEPTRRFIDFDPVQREKLAEFKELVRETSVIQNFTTPDDLAARVTADLAQTCRHETRPPTLIDQLTSEGGWSTNSAEETLILMVGAVYVGKTVYGSVLTHEPAAELARKGIQLEIHNETSRLLQQWKRLQQGEWTDKTTLYASDSAQFTLRQQSSKRLYKFCIQDTSGEYWQGSCDPDFDDGPHEQEGFIKHMHRCGGLAILLDVDEGAFHAEGRDALYANVFAQLAKSDTDSRFRRPVAFILTKCDLYPQLLSNPQSAPAYLQERYPQTYYQLTHHVATCRLFVTSAVGATDTEGKPTLIRPKGVWGPIVWLMGQLELPA